MQFNGFVGPTYNLNSCSIECQRSVNLYAEKLDSAAPKAQYYLRGTPGYELALNLPQPRIRGMWVAKGRMFVCTYSKLYEVYFNNTYVERGEIQIGSGLVGMSDNGLQLCIACGAKGFILTLEDNTFQEITAEGWRGSRVVTFLDGRFYFVELNSDRYFWSNLYDGLDIDILSFATAESNPDQLVNMVAAYQEVYAFGTNTVEVYYDSGDANAPLQRIQGAIVEYGCAAPYSVAKAENSLMWLGKDNRGTGIVFKIQGYSVERVSTHAVEQAIQSYESIDDAIAYTYQEDGHLFYVLNFSSANTTWCYDCITGLWHERAYLDSEGQLDRHRGNIHAYVFGNHYISDYYTDEIFVQSNEFYSDNGREKKYIRITPHAINELKRVRYNSMQVDMQTGIGNIDDTNPISILKWSNDAGSTWSNEHYGSIGKVGEYKTRVKFRRLAAARDRVFWWEFVGKCKVAIDAAYIEITPLAA